MPDAGAGPLSFVRSVSASISAPLEASGSILSAIALGAGNSRASLVEATALSRVTLSQRLGALLAVGLVREADATIPSGGRPTRLLTLNPNAAVILAADMGETFIRIAVTDLEPTIRAQETISFRIDEGPETALSRIAMVFDRLLSLRETALPIAGIGLSLPAPVDHRVGRVFGPSILAGWDDFPISDWLTSRFGAPAVVENDVNLMTLFEQRRSANQSEQLFFIKVGTGIGSGIMTEGRLYRGAQGAAGDIGHMQLFAKELALCRCGKLGCLEARAAGWALARDLRALGFDATDARDVVALVDQQVPEAIQLVRAAGRALGEAVSDAISILNPGRIVIGGTLARVSEHLLAGVREMVHQRCLPLATRDLQLEALPPVDEACLIGAAHCVIERIFAAESVEAWLARYCDWLDLSRRSA